MKQVVIKNSWNINNYVIEFTLDFTMYPNNAIIKELPITNLDSLNAFKISYHFQDLEKVTINVNDVSITCTDDIINEQYDFNIYCSFLDNIKQNCKDVVNNTFNDINTLNLTFFVENIFKISKDIEESESPTKKIKITPIIPKAIKANQLQHSFQPPINNICNPIVNYNIPNNNQQLANIYLFNQFQQAYQAFTNMQRVLNHEQTRDTPNNNQHN